MIINHWHTMLDMPKKDIEWHKEDINREFQELAEAKGFVDTWSEISDVVYTYTRARWSGHDIKRPVNIYLFSIGLIYMFPKYTLRYLFYYTVGKKIDKKLKLTEVRNPKKVEKLHYITEKYNLDPNKFEKECIKLSKFWIFLP